MNKNTLIRVILVLLVIASAGVFWIRGASDCFRVGREGRDFRGPYAASVSWLKGENPYDHTILTRRILDQGGLEEDVHFLHPPSVCVVLSPVSAMSWANARIVTGVIGAILILAMIPVTLQWVGLRVMQPAGLLFISMVLLFTPIHSGLTLGNLSVAAIAISLIGLRLVDLKQPIAGGILIALSMAIKPQIGGVLFLYIGATAQWRAFFATGLTYLAIFGIGAGRLWWAGIGWSEVAENWRYNMSQSLMVQGGERFTREFQRQRLHLVNLHILLHSFTDNIELVRRIAMVVAAVGSATWLAVYWWGRGRIPHVLSYGVPAAVSLTAVYHRQYDVTFLLPALAWLMAHWNGPARWAGRVALAASLVFVGTSWLTLADNLAEQGRIPEAVVNSWFWQGVVLPHRPWAMVIICLCFFVVFIAEARRRRAVLAPL